MKHFMQTGMFRQDKKFLPSFFLAEGYPFRIYYLNSSNRFSTCHFQTKESSMPLYEYRCEACDHQYEIVQSVSAKPEETICPKCNKAQSRRLMSSFASKIVGSHKPGFSEDKAYNMLNERMSKFAKLPPIMGQRAQPTAENSQPPSGE
jgi:putative FmdB family regulatory protein